MKILNELDDPLEDDSADEAITMKEEEVSDEDDVEANKFQTNLLNPLNSSNQGIRTGKENFVLSN